MNLQLDEAGMTFLVGAFVILSADAIIYYIFGRHIIRFFEGRWGFDGEAPTALTTGVFIGLSFALGILVEDVCYKYSDPRVYRPFEFVYGTLHIASHHHHDTNIKGAMQHGVLIEKLSATNPDLEPLGEEVFRSGIFEAVLGDAGKAHVAWALKGGPLPPTKDPKKPFDGLQRGISAVFYFAKNRVYNVENYFQELRRIQSRLEFSSTIAAVSLVSSGVCLLAGLLWTPVKWRSKTPWQVPARAALLVVAFLAIYMVGYIAYVHESEEFNKRVFGYHDSMLRSARSRVPVTTRPPETTLLLP